MENEKLKVLDLSETLLHILKRLKKKEDKFLEQYGVSHFHAPYLRNLFVFKELTLSNLTELIGVDKANTTRVIRDLMDKGYIEKVGNTERKYSVRLSPTGLEIASKFHDDAERQKEEFLKAFSREERKIFEELLLKLLKGVKGAENI